MRIVSLCPSITETLIDFGLADALVGITRIASAPAKSPAPCRRSAVPRTPISMPFATPARSHLRKRRGEHETGLRRARAGIRGRLLIPRRVAEVPAILRHFGQLTHKNEIAEARARAIEVRALEFGGRAAAAFHFAYLIWRDPWMTVNADTYVSDLFVQAGWYQRLRRRVRSVSRDSRWRHRGTCSRSGRPPRRAISFSRKDRDESSGISRPLGSSSSRATIAAGTASVRIDGIALVQRLRSGLSSAHEPALPSRYSAPFLAGGPTPIDETFAQKLLDSRWPTAGSMPTCYFEYRASGGFSYEEGILKSANRGVSMGLGVRVQKGDATGSPTPRSCFRVDEASGQNGGPDRCGRPLGHRTSARATLASPRYEFEHVTLDVSGSKSARILSAPIVQPAAFESPNHPHRSFAVRRSPRDPRGNQ